jgi:2-desacetyl-2-hydroxyethyl bacteriochlorophyllide A dehydrogenase
MRAVVLEALQQVSLAQVPVPEIAEDELLVQTGAATICTSDLHDIAANPFGATLPLTLGHEGAGSVAAVGSKVTGFAVGDRVVTHPVHPCGACRACLTGMAHLCMNLRHFGLNMPGTFADYYVVRADRARQLPTHVPYATGALFEPICVCLQALAQARLPVGEPLLILGDGPFGLLMARLAHAQGKTPVVVAGHQEFRLARAGTGVIAVNTAGMADPTNALSEVVGGIEYGAAILATEARSAIATGLACLGRKRRLVIFASLLGETPISLMTVQAKELEIVGACNDEDRLDAALAFLVTEANSLSELVTHAFPLTEVASALELAAHGQDQAIKVALVMEPSDSIT